MTESEALHAMLAVMQANGLDALRLRVGTSRYELVARADDVAAPAAPAVERRAQPASMSPSTQIAAANIKKVTAPIIGVFYRASAPGAETFVEVGDRVEVGQVLCILEAMKLMNEITSDFSGIVRRILPDNGALVSLGEEMFWIEP